MNWQTLDSLIDELERLIPPEPGIFHVEKHDWKPVWEQCKQIQEGFKSGARYPTKKEKEKAWARFTNLRKTASARRDKEKWHLQEISKYWRNIILNEVETARHKSGEDILFFFDPADAEEMKSRGRRLAKAGKILSQRKHEMLAEHKSECFERIKEVRENHDNWWANHKRRIAEHKRQKREEHEKRIAGKQKKREEARERIKSNLEKNRERYRRAATALEKQRRRAEDAREKLQETRSEKWELIFSEWITDAESIIDDIEESLKRIERWIEDDLQKLNNFK